jgi:hypothetical protein
MVKRFFLSVLTSVSLLTAAAADYFPVQERNAWTFSYTSISMPVVPNPLITKDSGTVKWDIFENRNVEMVNVYSVNVTYSLMRRTQTRSDTTLSDSVFSPPRTTIDTVILTERIDQAGIAFSAATCAFAVHDPTTTMPAELSSKDTTVSFQGTAIAGKKMIASDCSCLDKWYSYSFTLGPAIGPVEADIRLCSGVVGGSVTETWKLIDRDYPTAVIKGNVTPDACTTVAAEYSSGRITCSLNLGYPSPARIEVLDIKGRLIRPLFKGNLTAGSHRYIWSIPTKISGIAMLRIRTGTRDRCVRIITGTP